MFNAQSLLIEHFVKELSLAYQQTYNLTEPHYANVLEWTGRLALENIANSDALYHDVHHTIMVTLVGQSILKGKHLCEGGITPKDWLNYMIALLCHDIGYVRGVCQLDNNGSYSSGIGNETIDISVDGTDAALTPYHVERSKKFVQERFRNAVVIDIDVDTICNYIEMTRFPVPQGDFYQDTSSYGGLVRAADFIGQLGDPNYLRKIPALYYEFEETGENVHTGYTSPGHMRSNFTQFYWKVVRPHIQDALRYLRKTQEGKQWIANLHSHVFDVQYRESQE